MTQSTYDLCLFRTKNNSGRFKIVGLQTDDILFLADKIFAIKEEKQLYRANLQPKKEKNLTTE